MKNPHGFVPFAVVVVVHLMGYSVVAVVDEHNLDDTLDAGTHPPTGRHIKAPVIPAAWLDTIQNRATFCSNYDKLCRIFVWTLEPL